MGITLYHAPPAASIAGAAYAAGAGKRGYREDVLAEQVAQAKAQMKQGWERLDLQREAQEFTKESFYDQMRAGVESQERGIAAQRDLAEMGDTRQRELTAMGIKATDARAQADREAMAARQQSGFEFSREQGAQAFIDQVPGMLSAHRQKMEALKTEKGITYTDAQSDHIKQLYNDYDAVMRRDDLTKQQKADALRPIVGAIVQKVPVGKAPPTGEQMFEQQRVKLPDGRIALPNGRGGWTWSNPPKPVADPNEITMPDWRAADEKWRDKRATLVGSLVGKVKSDSFGVKTYWTEADAKRLSDELYGVEPPSVPARAARGGFLPGEAIMPSGLTEADLMGVLPADRPSERGGHPAPALPPGVRIDSTLVYDADMSPEQGGVEVNSHGAPRAYDRIRQRAESQGRPASLVSRQVAMAVLKARKGDSEARAFLNKWFQGTELRWE